MGKTISFYLLSIVMFLSCTFHISKVLADIDQEQEPTLDQPTFLQHNVSDSDISEVNINPSESNADIAQLPDVASDPKPTNILELVPESVLPEVHSDIVNVIINNDTPVVISRTDSATEELHKKANLPLSSETNIEITETNATQQTSEANNKDVEADSETEEKNEPSEKAAEEIPSFSEWAQKHLEEVEKKEQLNSSAQSTISNNNTKPSSGAKLRWKNYADVDCGAKVILANPEAQNTWAILVRSRDEYILNPCNSRFWFIVELCESIQIKRIDLANYELFSSSPKEFTVSVSDRFPTRDWSLVGQFTAQDERDNQNFNINTETFGKYVKVEIKSHYGSEHYCPLSLFRAYGTSVFEVLQKDDPAHEQPIEDDDDDDPLDHFSKDDASGNLLSLATDAVLSMVKKAAQVFNRTNDSSQIIDPAKSRSPIMKTCTSPSHYVICTNCSDVLFGEIFHMLSCRARQIKNILGVPFIAKALERSAVCQDFGLDFRDKAANNSLSSASVFVESFFPPSFLGAMCNVLAINHKKVLHNISYHYANTTEQIHNEDLVDIESADSKVLPIMEENKDLLEQILDAAQSTEPLTLENNIINSKTGCSTDTTYTSQIKPSKSLTMELHVHSDHNTQPVSTEQVNYTVGELDQQDTLDSLDPVVVDASTEIPNDLDLQSDNIEESLDKGTSELNTDSTVPATSATTTTTTTTAGNVQGQKESVFLRLSNRIKTLERNMSLSVQYLEELSKRYKKQVEEMQRVFENTEKTLSAMAATQDERFEKLEEAIITLSRAMEELQIERNTWQTTSCWLFLVLGSVFVYYIFRKYTASRPPRASPAKDVEVQRRNSVDVVTRATSKKKKRRPSDQALKIVASSASGDQEKLPRKRKKKSSNPSDLYKNDNREHGFSPHCTSSKIWLKPCDQEWVEGRGRVIEDIPFPLEESDVCTLENFPLVSEMSTINAPDYMQTAANFRIGRSSLKNGNLKSANEIIKKRHSSPMPPFNGDIFVAEEPNPKKEKKGFKKLFKKVF